MRYRFWLYNRRERGGLFFLLLLVAIGYGVSSWFLSRQTEEASPDTAHREWQSYRSFLSSLPPTPATKVDFPTQPASFQSPRLNPFPFDPNTADSTTLSRLGLPHWMVNNILRYRARQGRFREVADFSKLYGLTSEQYETLRPYVQIENVEEKKRSSLLLTQPQPPSDSTATLAAGTQIELNTADTTLLKKIPGIGSALAKRIVNYRKRLGGYYAVEQLREIQLDAEALATWLRVDTNLIRPLPLYRTSLKQLIQHPYINFYQAQIIDRLRKKRQWPQRWEELSLYDEFSEADLARLRPYVDLAP